MLFVTHMLYSEPHLCCFSDTEGAAIYYTLNGTKPTPFQTIGPAAKSTMLYLEPFVLSQGKRTIKAVAVTRLDRSTVSKIGLYQVFYSILFYSGRIVGQIVYLYLAE